MKNSKTPNWRIFFRRSALIFLAIHKVLLRQIALTSQTASNGCEYRFLNKSRRIHQAGLRYKSLYCFAEFSQDRSFTISRRIISSQYLRWSK
mgnify:CR=1 FL=1